MTPQDWVIIAAGWVALAIVLAGVMWDQHHHGRRLDRHRHELTNHARRLLLQEAAPDATSIGAPMPTVGHAQPRNPRPAMGIPATHHPGQEGATGGWKTALQRPPALTDLQHVLQQAGRALTATEMATQLGRQPWDLIGDIDRDIKAGRIEAVPGHTAGRTAYRLADADTVRLPHGMPLLPGAVSR